VNQMCTDARRSAIVVTFHPQAEHVRHLAKVREQVDVLIVVDNGSNAEGLAALRSAGEEVGFRLIENGDNLGIGAALNRGVREAQREGCQWVVLLDQDSVVSDRFILTMIEEFESYRSHRKILQIVPRYVDPETGTERPVSRYNDGGVFLTITSGSLFPMEVFDKCGMFQEDLFIYCIDDDYSLRIRKSGYFIGMSKKAVLLHRSGHPTSRKLLGMKISTRNYRPEVHYYYARNKVRILRTYGQTFPRLILPTLREFATIPLKISLMEDASWRKLKLFTLGLLDGFAGRTGRVREVT
jgi:rhamnosyltransferase